MPETSLDLIEVNVADWAGAVSWYRRAFDLEVAYEDEQHQWCELAFPRGGPRFALRGLADVEHGAPQPFVISLKVADLDATVEDLAGRGVQAAAIKDAIRPTGQRYRWANITDPEGNGLRVFEWADVD